MIDRIGIFILRRKPWEVFLGSVWIGFVVGCLLSMALD